MSCASVIEASLATPAHVFDDVATVQKEQSEIVSDAAVESRGVRYASTMVKMAAAVKNRVGYMVLVNRCQGNVFIEEL